eukprot:10241330-Lingulodinium_polyedra.AAC.1
MERPGPEGLARGAQQAGCGEVQDGPVRLAGFRHAAPRSVDGTFRECMPPEGEGCCRARDAH